MDHRPGISRREDSFRARDRGGQLAPRRRLRPLPGRGIALAIGLALVSLGLTACGLLLGMVRGSLALVSAGLAVLIITKLGALAAFGRWRVEGSHSGASAMAEAVTLGSLLAFVASLALRSHAALPRSLILADWIASLAILGACRERPSRSRGSPATTDRPFADPAVASLIRDRRVLVVGAETALIRALLRELRTYGPESLTLARFDAGPSPERPDLLIISARRSDPSTAVALATRRRVSEALRAGALAVALILPDEPEGSHSLADRVVRALSGLTGSRLIRVRLGGCAGTDVSRLAIRLLKLAARCRDGTLATIGGSRGVRLQEAPDEVGDAGALWEELDRLAAE